MKSSIQIFTTLVLLLSLLSCKVKFWEKESEETTTSTGGGSSSDTDLESCANTNTFFSHSPINIGDFMGIVPLGNLNPSGHTFPTSHLYFYITNSDGEGPSDSVDFFASGDGFITSIRASEHITAKFTDYNLNLKPCEEFILQYGHVQTLSEKLNNAIDGLSSSCQDAYETGGEWFQNCNYEVMIEVSAGEKLGTTGGVQNQYALDIGAVDYREVQNQFANNDRYSDGNDQFYKVCAIDYFEPEIKAQIEEFFGSYNGSTQRTIEPLCGDLVQEQAGTALGRWYREGEDDNHEDPHLALVYDNIIPTLGSVSVGTSIPELYAHTFEIEESGLINRDFADIGAGDETYCYNMTGASGAFLLKMISSNEIKVEYQSDTDCNGSYSLSEDAITFVR